MSSAVCAVNVTMEQCRCRLESSDFTKCSTCTQLKDQYERAATDASREEIIDLRVKHDDQVIAERVAYQRARMKARREPSELTCLIIDGMDQSKTNVPHFVVKDKDNAHLAQLPVHFTGVLVHSPTAEGKIPLIYHDVKHVPHDSNLTIHCLTEALHGVKDNLGAKLFLQLDNCARENKNRFILSYVSLLVQLDLFKEAIIHFLPVGHTHEDVDQLFSCISSALHHADAFTLKDLEEIASGSYTPPVTVIPVTMVQNVKDELNKHMHGSFKNHSKPLWFRFRKSDRVTYMHYKLWDADPWEPAADSNWPMGLVCLQTIPDHKKHLPWVETSLEKAELDRLLQEVPHYYNSRLPDPARVWWNDFLSNGIQPYQQAPGEREWRLTDVLQRDMSGDTDEENAPLEFIRSRLAQTCPQVTIGQQGKGPKGICVVGDRSSLEPEMFAAVHCEETAGRPFLGKLTEVREQEVDIHWFKGSWTGMWRPWMTKGGRYTPRDPYVSTVPKSSIILFDFSLTAGLKLKQTTVRELRSRYEELDG